MPNAVKISGIITATVSGRANTTTSARNLPSTMPGMLTGLVSSNWSVLLRRSSAKLRMLMAGSRNSMISVVVYKTDAKSDEAYIRLRLVKYSPRKNRLTAAVTYPTMPV